MGGTGRETNQYNDQCIHNTGALLETRDNLLTLYLHDMSITAHTTDDGSIYKNRYILRSTFGCARSPGRRLLDLPGRHACRVVSRVARQRSAGLYRNARTGGRIRTLCTRNGAPDGLRDAAACVRCLCTCKFACICDWPAVGLHCSWSRLASIASRRKGRKAEEVRGADGTSTTRAIGASWRAGVVTTSIAAGGGSGRLGGGG